MDSKKISFGFNKTIKKTNLFGKNKKEEHKVDLIKCLEGQQIKLMIEKKKDLPLLIEMKKNENSISTKITKKRNNSVTNEKISSLDRNIPIISNKLNCFQTENVEKRAAYELLTEQQNKRKLKEDVLPAIAPNIISISGANESTFEDYESIPIQQFGMAMLRGMGWTEKSKEHGDCKMNVPNIRPKGMGLGADKVIKHNVLLIQPEANEVLEVKKQAFVRILGGKHKDAYGQIEGFDDQASRVIVRMAIGGGKESFNEFLCQPVSKNEYVKYGKCINTTKYEKYKGMENEH